jgi:hypothetical protein
MSVRGSTNVRWTDRPVVADTASVLVNVVWIVEQMDGAGLEQIGDVPVLELAKHISIGRRAA